MENSYMIVALGISFLIFKFFNDIIFPARETKELRVRENIEENLEKLKKLELELRYIKGNEQLILGIRRTVNVYSNYVEKELEYLSKVDFLTKLFKFKQIMNRYINLYQTTNNLCNIITMKINVA